MIYLKSDNIESVIGKETEEVIKELLESRLSRSLIGLEESMKYIDFVCDCIDLLHYKCHKISLNPLRIAYRLFGLDKTQKSYNKP